MKLTEIAKIIIELTNSKKPTNYVRGLIWEYIELKKYDKLLKEQEEEEDIDNPEVETDEEPNIEEPEIDIEEPETEPDATVSTGPTPSEPKTVPTPRKTPTPSLEPQGIQTISRNEARDLLSYKGKIFSAIFTKKDGTRRAMNGMTGVRKYTSGGELPYSPKDKGVIPVYDLKIGRGPKGYRMINIDGLEALKIGGKQYKIDKFIKEIKINKPGGFIKGKHYNIEIRNNGRNDYNSYEDYTYNKIDEDDLSNLEFYSIEPNGDYIFISEESGEVIPIPPSKILNRKEIRENMKKTELREIIKEVIKSTQPQRSPSQPDRETITKPETDTPERKPKRRTLSPPTEAPSTKPKAEGIIKENEEDIANKIAQRFNKLSK